MVFGQTNRREFIAALGGCAVSVVFCLAGEAQDGNYGVGHGNWHQDFYSKLQRNDGKVRAAT